MDREIKRLLKLTNIPNFELTNKEKEKLAKWKTEQKKIKVPKKVERIIPEGFVELDGIGANDRNTLIATSDAPESTKKKKTYRKSSRTKKVQNVVSEKEIGNIVSEPIDKQES